MKQKHLKTLINNSSSLSMAEHLFMRQQTIFHINISSRRNLFDIQCMNIIKFHHFHIKKVFFIFIENALTNHSFNPSIMPSHIVSSRISSSRLNKICNFVHKIIKNERGAMCTWKIIVIFYFTTDCERRNEMY